MWPLLTDLFTCRYRWKCQGIEAILFDGKLLCFDPDIPFKTVAYGKTACMPIGCFYLLQTEADTVVFVFPRCQPAEPGATLVIHGNGHMLGLTLHDAQNAPGKNGSGGKPDSMSGTGAVVKRNKAFRPAGLMGTGRFQHFRAGRKRLATDGRGQWDQEEQAPHFGPRRRAGISRRKRPRP